MTVAETHAKIAMRCRDIAKLFKPGAKVTVVVRNPAADREPHSAAMMVGDDDLSDMQDAIRYLATRDEKRLEPSDV